MEGKVTSPGQNPEVGINPSWGEERAPVPENNLFPKATVESDSSVNEAAAVSKPEPTPIISPLAESGEVKPENSATTVDISIPDKLIQDLNSDPATLEAILAKQFEGANDQR